MSATNEELTRLLELAGKATQADWHVCGASGGECSCMSILYRDGIIAEVRDSTDYMADAPSPAEAQANKRYIAAAQPRVLTAIITELLEHRNELAAAKTFGGGFYSESVSEATRDWYRDECRSGRPLPTPPSHS